jgi:hypothetical protein
MEPGTSLLRNYEGHRTRSKQTFASYSRKAGKSSSHIFFKKTFLFVEKTFRGENSSALH